MDFPEYRNFQVETLKVEAGEGFRCFCDPKGLPNKILYYPIASDLFPGREDEPSDLNVKMELVGSHMGKQLDSYLQTTLGLRPEVDYRRHGNGQRGGRSYFNILTDAAVDKLTDRARQHGDASFAKRLAQQAGVRSFNGRQ